MGEKPSFFSSHEISPQDEPRIREVILHSHARLSYGAVSLDPYRAIHPESSKRKKEGYASKSLKNVERITNGNFLRARGDGGVLCGVDIETAEKLYHMVYASVMLAQTERMEHHNKHSTQNLVRTPEVIAAEMGLATPAELLSIAINNPELESIELAKQTRPFVYGPATEMDHAIVDALQPYEDRLVYNDWHIRTKIKGINEDIPAAIVVTKQPIAMIDLGNDEFIEIILRQGDVIRGDDMVKNTTNPPLDRLIRNRNKDQNPGARHAELAALVANANFNRQTPSWLIPMTTSVYAHRIKRQ